MAVIGDYALGVVKVFMVLCVLAGIGIGVLFAVGVAFLAGVLAW